MGAFSKQLLFNIYASIKACSICIDQSQWFKVFILFLRGKWAEHTNHLHQGFTSWAEHEVFYIIFASTFWSCNKWTS